MKIQLGWPELVVSTSATLVAFAQPVWAAQTEVTNVQLQTSQDGITLVLNTQGNNRPPIFTVSRGRSTVVDIDDTQLRLTGTRGFEQANPVPGITSVTVQQFDADTVRVTVNGAAQAPAAQVIRQDGSERLGLSFKLVESLSESPQAPAPLPPPTGQRPNAVPPFRPRAVAPPVGDIAVAPLDVSPDQIRLNTDTIIPRLLLREAPVREVLTLLARAAGVNVVFAEGEAGGAADQEGTAATTGGGPTISLDIENESVQDVFNYVLQVSNLQANRVGNTIFVGRDLPADARNIMTRSYRLNQVAATSAANFLAAQGAETQLPRETLQIQTVGEGASARTVETRTPQILKLQAEAINGPLLLRGLSVLVDDRLNSITLVGPPQQVQIASNFLTQLDARRRQVAVNVKVIDINLLNTKDFNTSFSFGSGRSFFAIDNGAAVFNYGGITPPSADSTTGSLTSPPTIPNPLSGEPFLGEGFFNPPPGAIPSALPPVDPNANPLQPGITDFTPGQPATPTTPATPDIFTFGLPSLFQYPLRLLSSLRAQIVSGNAKVLTDPTIIVQEGEESSLELGQEVFAGFETVQTSESTSGAAIFTRRPIIKNAGVNLVIAANRIDDNGYVTLVVQPEVSAPASSAQTADGVITLLSQRRLESGRVRLRDGQTLILSGIIQDSDRTTVSKVPILGDIPLLGRLFRSTNTQRERREVIILLTPKVLSDNEQSSFGYEYTPSPEVENLLNR